MFNILEGLLIWGGDEVAVLLCLALRGVHAAVPKDIECKQRGQLLFVMLSHHSMFSIFFLVVFHFYKDLIRIFLKKLCVCVPAVAAVAAAPECSITKDIKVNNITMVCAFIIKLETGTA